MRKANDRDPIAKRRALICGMAAQSPIGLSFAQLPKTIEGVIGR